MVGFAKENPSVFIEIVVRCTTQTLHDQSEVGVDPDNLSFREFWHTRYINNSTASTWTLATTLLSHDIKIVPSSSIQIIHWMPS